MIASDRVRLDGLIELLREEIAAHDGHSPHVECCWWCQRDVNGRSIAKEPHDANCWLIRVEAALLVLGDARPHQTEEK